MLRDGDESQNRSRSLMYLWTYARFGLPWLVLALVASLLTTATTLVLARLLQEAVDSAVLMDSYYFAASLKLLAAVTLASLSLAYLRTYSAAGFSERALLALRERIASSLVAAQAKDIERLASGDTLSRLSNDLSRIGIMLSSYLPDLLLRPLLATASLVFLLHIHPVLTLLTVAVMPLAILIAGRVSRPLTDMGTEVQATLGTVTSVANETLGGIETIRAYGMEDDYITRHRRAVKAWMVSSLMMVRRMALLHSLSGALAVLPFLVCFGVGGFMVIGTQITLGQLFAFVTLLNHLTFPLSGLPPLLGQIQGSLGALERAALLTEMIPERDVGLRYSSAQLQDGILALAGVSLRHPSSGDLILKDVGFRIRAGELVLLVGASGSGKSTILKVATGLYSPDKGSVSLFGHDLREWHPQSARCCFAVVEQRPFLLQESIEANITVGWKDCTRADVESAIDLAGARDFVLGLPHGLDTIVGEHGGSISGGQRQLVVLARALLRVLKGVPILMLDEAFSSLDLAAEVRFVERLRELLSPVAVLMVTHRMAVAEKADRILVVSDGSIVAEGIHDHLLESDHRYRSLYVAQQEGMQIRKGQ